MGCDATVTKVRRGVKISIHAPMWGATILPSWLAIAVNISIHAPMWGATSRGYIVDLKTIFQSTHPCGVRHVRMWHRTMDTNNFNPRTHVGCDLV